MFEPKIYTFSPKETIARLYGSVFLGYIIEFYFKKRNYLHA